MTAVRIRCFLCVHIGDPMAARSVVTTVDRDRQVCAGHARMMSERGWDSDTALAEIRRDPSGWAL